MYQKVTLIGRLGGEPEMRYTPDGTPVTSFSVATDRQWVDASGTRQQRTVWFRVTAWRRLAEVCNQCLTKGKLVYVEGDIAEPKPFRGRDGDWRASLEVVAREIRFLSTRGDQSDAQDVEDEEELPF